MIVVHKILDKKQTRLAGIFMIEYMCWSIIENNMEKFILKFDIENLIGCCGGNTYELQGDTKERNATNNN